MRRDGFEPEDYDAGAFEVWPENWPAFLLYDSICNQWRTGGMGGPIALDYGVLFHRMDRMKLSDDDYEQMFQDIKAIESGALSVYQKPKD